MGCPGIGSGKVMPGYVSHKAFTAADGERLTLVEFESEAHVRAWAVHPVHAQAKQLGREHFYESFQLQVCEVLRQSSFTSSEAPAD